MCDTDDRRFRNRWMRDREIFDVDGADPLATRFDDVLGAIGDLNKAVFIERRHVASRKPAVAQNAVAVGLEISRGHPGPSNQQVAECHAVARQLAPLAVDDLQLDAQPGATLLGAQLALVGLRQREMLRLGVVRGRQMTRLGHSPGVDYLDAGVRDSSEHRRWTRRPSDQGAFQARQLEFWGLQIFEQAEPY